MHHIYIRGIIGLIWLVAVLYAVYVEWELQADLEMFMRAYIDRMTPDFVNLSID